MGNRRRLHNRLEALLKQYDGQIEKAFLDAIRARANSINMAELAAAIEARDFNRAVNIAGLTRADMFPFDTAITQAYVAGGSTVAAAAPAFAVSFGFDGRATRAEAWARSHVGGLVTNIVNEQLDLLRETIGTQLAGGIGPRQVALDIAGRIGPGNRRVGGFIGLDRQSMRWRDNARRELETLDRNYFTRKGRDKRLDSTILTAMKNGKPLAKADIDRAVGRYSDTLLLDRGKRIARTESITALRAGRDEGVEQAIEAGAIAQESLKRIWNATGDARTRPDHMVMNGQEVDGMNTPFTLPDGSRMRYPGDTSLGASAAQTIMCRCFQEYRVDWLRG
jgi:hypothetical protein